MLHASLLLCNLSISHQRHGNKVAARQRHTTTEVRATPPASAKQGSMYRPHGPQGFSELGRNPTMRLIGTQEDTHIKEKSSQEGPRFLGYSHRRRNR